MLARVDGRALAVLSWSPDFHKSTFCMEAHFYFIKVNKCSSVALAVLFRGFRLALAGERGDMFCLRSSNGSWCLKWFGVSELLEKVPEML